MLVIKSIPSFSRRSILLWTTHFSNLNSGIPSDNKPPITESLSKTFTLCPALFNCCAAARPAGPDPITAIVFPVLSVVSD